MFDGKQMLPVVIGREDRGLASQLAAFSRQVLSPDAQGERECSLNNKLTIF